MSQFSASPAVMATRAPQLVERDDPQRALWRKLDYYPTPPWAARAGALLISGLDPDAFSVWEPACGQGHMAEALMSTAVFGVLRASDLHAHGFGAVHDFLEPDLPESLTDPAPDWVVTNPPFRHAAAFVQRGLEVATSGVAILARLAFMESATRFDLLFGECPVSVVAPFIERVPMQLGRYDPRGDTATAYAWFIWRKGAPPTPGPILSPIPPGTRLALTHGDDARRWAPLAPAPLLEHEPAP